MKGTKKVGKCNKKNKKCKPVEVDDFASWGFYYKNVFVKDFAMPETTDDYEKRILKLTKIEEREKEVEKRKNVVADIKALQGWFKNCLNTDKKCSKTETQN